MDYIINKEIIAFIFLLIFLIVELIIFPNQILNRTNQLHNLTGMDYLNVYILYLSIFFLIIYVVII